jgi:hypothetical protein
MRVIFTIISILIAGQVQAADIAPTVGVENLRFSGEFDREAIRRSIGVYKSKLELCKSSQPSIDFSVEFQIDQNGKARAIANNGYPLPSDNALNCVSTVIGKMQFPIPQVDSTDSIILPIKYDAPKTNTVGKNQKSSKATNETDLSEADKNNQEYLNRVKANALKSMNEQNARQNAQLKATLACNDAYAKDRLLEKYHQCLDQAKYGGSSSESSKTCNKTCESQRMNLEVGCQKCSGGSVERQSCISSCQRNIASQIDQCKTGCR